MHTGLHLTSRTRKENPTVLLKSSVHRSCSVRGNCPFRIPSGAHSSGRTHGRISIWLACEVPPQPPYRKKSHILFWMAYGSLLQRPCKGLLDRLRTVYCPPANCREEFRLRDLLSSRAAYRSPSTASRPGHQARLRTLLCTFLRTVRRTHIPICFLMVYSLVDAPPRSHRRSNPRTIRDATNYTTPLYTSGAAPHDASLRSRVVRL